jgi:hypothetical protein
MIERAHGAFGRLPNWQRIAVASLATCITLFFVWSVILILFAFALTLGIILAAIASPFVALGVRRLMQG